MIWVFWVDENAHFEGLFSLPISFKSRRRSHGNEMIDYGKIERNLASLFMIPGKVSRNLQLSKCIEQETVSINNI